MIKSAIRQIQSFALLRSSNVLRGLVAPFLLLACVLAPFAHAFLNSSSDEELLSEQDAFAASVTVVTPELVRVRWKIADNYYMYRKAFAVAVADNADGISAGTITIPPGKAKQDEFLGAVETYTSEVVIDVPVLRTDQGAKDIVIHASGQGCNEPVGVCYPPMTTELPIQLAALDTTGASPTDSGLNLNLTGSDSTSISNPINSLQSLNDLLSGTTSAADDFPPAEEVFGVDVLVEKGEFLQAKFDIRDGFYLYRDKIDFTVSQGDAQIASINKPAGVNKVDETFGDTVVYYNKADVAIGLQRAGASEGTLSVTAHYQGCAEKGICYPPQETTFDLFLPALMSQANADSGGSGTGASTSLAALSTTSASALGTASKDRTFFGYILLAFGVGVLLTFTPCVLPLIPILSGIIASQGNAVNRTRGGLLATVYVMGTAATYLIIGVVAGATGDQLQAYFQNVWAIGVMVIIFVAMALSMFGLYDIQVPGFLQSRLQEKANGMAGFHGVFIMGMLSALIVGACVSPLLISVLSVAIARGDPVLGGATMFAMAMGMGVFLVLLGIGAGSVLPKAGAWMDRVKQGFGVMLLAVAIYLMSNLPQVPVLLLWSALFIVTGVYLGATQALPDDANGWRYMWKGTGTVLMVWGVVAMLGGFAGKRDVLDPLPDALKSGLIAQGGSGTGTQGARSPAADHSLFVRVKSVAELDKVFAQAKADQKPVMLDYYADWCVDCIRMEKNTFQNPAINERLIRDFVLVQVDVTDPKDADRKALKQRFGVYGPPAILFFDPNNNEIADQRLYGYRDVSEFSKILDKVWPS